ncbi:MULTISPECIES: DUF4123 domain-containing protein [Pseudomonas]|jgi:hypothetical protein|uniref:DUF4123 domain-containing protein n=1 Tax=Pseudomonas TaxID=286 RepID=UPI000357D12B|nr:MULTISPECIES: DUF4123 domain-containing protein [Pseudomonas]EPJ84527.1 hypothetical protein CFII64_14180 [Pseudomonas sp. CFII64]
MNTWFLLERTEHLLPNLYRQVAQPDLTRLFDSTSLAGYDEQSPLLVKDDDSKLSAAILQAPEQWPGLMLHSDHSTEAVLAHLRQILFVNFEENRKGVLRYSNPATASYFFPACTVDELRFWLGPLTRLSWYGGSWPDRATGQMRWHEMENPAAHQWQALTFAHQAALSSNQQQALETQQQEHVLYLQSHLQQPSTGQES